MADTIVKTASKIREVTGIVLKIAAGRKMKFVEVV